MSAVDYMPVLLAQITDLQLRVTKQESVLSAMKTELERLTGRNINVSNDTTVKTSVALLPTSSNTYVKQNRGTPSPRDGSSSGERTARKRPQIAKGDDSRGKELTIKDVLKPNEEVTLQIGTGKDSEGNFTYTTAIAVFDGSDLNVTKCDLVSSLVGTKSSKPGEILYKFIDLLKENGHIKRTFSIAPWKLCFVERDGKRLSLEQLRSQ